eukprot:gene6773-7872_t
MASQNIYDDKNFYDNYAQLPRSKCGMKGMPEWETVKSMLPDINGKKVIDLGSGYGWFCGAARQLGAKDVEGVDLSEKMIAKAQEINQDGNIQYRQADLETLELPVDTYDLVYSSLTIHYIVALERLLKQIYGSLHQGGSFVFTMEHAIFTCDPNQWWSTDDKGNSYWKVTNYQMEGDRSTNFLADGVMKQHRKLSTVINMLIKCGFTIDIVDEWGPSDAQIKENPDLAIEKHRPMFVLYKVSKK